MKRSLMIAALFLYPAILCGEAFACTCAQGPKERQSSSATIAERRSYYKNEFKGYLFTGSVSEIRSYPNQKVLFIKVDGYWLKTTPTPGHVVVLTSAKESQCGLPVKLGGTYFFKAHNSSWGVTSLLCDYLDDGDISSEGKTAKEVIKLFGPALRPGNDPRPEEPRKPRAIARR